MACHHSPSKFIFTYAGRRCQSSIERFFWERKTERKKKEKRKKERKKDRKKERKKERKKGIYRKLPGRFLLIYFIFFRSEMLQF